MNMNNLTQSTNETQRRVVPYVTDKLDITPLIIQKLKEENDNILFFNEFYIYENGYWKKRDQYFIKKLIQKFCEDTGFEKTYFKHYKNVDDLLKQAQLDLYKEINSKKNVLNFTNGTLELDTMQFREHRKEDYLFYCLPYKYDNEAQCPKWLEFLDEVLPQKDLQTAIQEAVAYLLSGLHLEKITYLKGNGRNGKSVYLEVLNGVLGQENVSHIPIETIVKNDGKGIYQMLNKLANITYETSSSILNTPAFKSYNSGEPMNVKKLYHDEYTTTNYPQTIVASNSMPRSTDNSEGFFRRLNIIPFNVTIPLEKVNPNLKNELLEESAGILNWIIEGIIRLRENKRFTPCQIIEDLQNQLRADQDNVFGFIYENNYIPSKTQKIQFNQLYGNFETFCLTNDYKPVRKKTFKQRLSSLGYLIKNSTNNQLYVWIDKEPKTEFQEVEEETSPQQTHQFETVDLFGDETECPF